MNKPLIIYISGAPGSGKTTLARLIADQLYVPVVSSDLIHGGVAFSNPEHDREQTLLEVFVPTLVNMLKKGISLVTDQVLMKGASEANIIDKLRPYAFVVNIHTVCTDPIGRYIEKIKTSCIPSIMDRRDYLLERAAVHRNNLDRISQPLDLSVPVLIVTTDDGYDPSLNEIIKFIKESYHS